MKMDTAIPPRYRRNPISRHSFVRETKKRRLRFFKAAVSNGRVHRAAVRWLFFFCRRPADRSLFSR